jgi:hypothetical protein
VTVSFVDWKVTVKLADNSIYETSSDGIRFGFDRQDFQGNILEFEVNDNTFRAGKQEPKSFPMFSRERPLSLGFGPYEALQRELLPRSA